MRAPWFVDVHKQAAVMCKIANRLYGRSDFAKVMNAVQIHMWQKFDAYMEKMRTA